jgi:pimeloyl-ACP methyl ester carboxylesterase
MQKLIKFLLVHGSWHGPWCWRYLQDALHRRGFASEVVALPSVGDDITKLGNFSDDAAAVSAAAIAIESEIIVVGHSYGGAVVSEASFEQNVKRLVFLAAFMPDGGRSYVSYLPPGPLPPYVGIRDDGTFEVPKGQAREFFYHDCAPEVAAWAEERLQPQSQSVLASTVTTASWRKFPSTYILSLDDRALPSDFQRQFTGQATNTLEFASSHSPMLSKPDELAEMLEGIADER